MILYIYSVKNFNLDNFLNCDEINIEKSNNIINGFISIDCENIPFILNIKLNLLYLNVKKRSKKRKAFKILYRCLNGEIEIFRPSFDKERKMLCESSDKSIKFLHDDKLEYSKVLTNKYCKNSLDEDYYLFEATIRFKEYEFLYYRNAIKFKNEYIRNILKIIEKYLGE